MDKIKLPAFHYLAIPLSPDDLLQLETIAVTSNLTIEIEGTALDKTGNLVPFRFLHDTSSSLTILSSTFRLGYQALLSVTVHTRKEGIPDGDCYSRLTLVKSFTNSVFPHRKLLAEGYVATVASIGYGSPSINGAPLDHSFIQNIAIADPAQGATTSFVVPSFTMLSPMSIRLTIQADISVFNRIPRLVFRLPPGNDHSYSVAFNTVATATNNYNFGFGLGANSFVSNLSIVGCIPPISLPSGSTILFECVNLQAGDQLSDITILTKRTTMPF